MTFVEYFRNNVCKVRIVNKRKSVFMKFLAACLWLSDKMKITDVGDFYGYVTTIGKTIYGPNTWSTKMEPNSTLLHELTHVMESREYPFYEIQYIFSSKKRAFYESICIQTEMLQRPGLAINIDYRRSEASFLVGYGCKYEDAYKELEDRSREVKRCRPNKCALTVSKALKDWSTSHKRVP